MGCNCHKPQVVRTSTVTASGSPGYRLVFPDGRSVTYATKLEADAANVRAGGTGRILFN